MTRREVVLVASGFALLTVLLTYPQIGALRTAVGTHYDALFSIWRLAWIAHAVPRQPAHLFDANIFYPERNTLAYSDAMPLPAFLAAPALWAGANEIAVYNGLLLLSFVFSGIAMYVLVRRLTGSSLAAWFAGVVFAFQPYRFAHYAQIELLWGWPIPLAIWALDRLIVSRRPRDGVLLGVLLGAQAWSSIYYFVFLVTVVAILGLILVPGRPRAEVRAMLAPFLIAAAIVVALVGPYATKYASAAASIGLRGSQDVVDWSPGISNYLIAPHSNWLHGSRAGGTSIEKMLFPGLAAVIIAIVGLIPPVDRRRIAYLVTALVALEISLGANGITGAWVFHHVWIYRGLRVPARMSVVVSAMIAVLGGYGISRIVRTGGRAASWVAVALVGTVLVESASTPLPLMGVEGHPTRIDAWLRAQPRSAVMDWPLPKPSDLGSTRTPWYMYESTYHWQPLVEGYSGFYPESYLRFLDGVRNFPSEDAIEYLRRDDVKFVMLHSVPDTLAYIAMRNAVGAAGAFELVADERVDSGEVALYRLKP